MKLLPWRVLLYAGVLLLPVLPRAVHTTRVDGLRGMMTATPAQGAPLTLDAQQAQEVAVLVDFIHAYNAGQVGTALSLFGPTWIWSDCDYRRGTVLVGRGKASLVRWLQGRRADHDRFEIGHIFVGTVQEDALGVTFKRRTSETLRSLGRPRGIASPLMTKVLFYGRSSVTGRPLIDEFANGPYGGSPDSCRVRP